jgi:hypothetical protein
MTRWDDLSYEWKSIITDTDLGEGDGSLSRFRADSGTAR